MSEVILKELGRGFYYWEFANFCEIWMHFMAFVFQVVSSAFLHLSFL
jgi:hypothetical protein